MPSYSNLKLVTSGDRVLVSFQLDGQRFRFADGTIIQSPHKPNRRSCPDKAGVALELLHSFKQALDSGWHPRGIQQTCTLDTALNSISIPSRYSDKHQYALRTTLNRFQAYARRQGWNSMPLDKLSRHHCASFLVDHCSTASTHNHERQHLTTLLRLALPESVPNPVRTIPKQVTKELLHQPFDDVKAVLNDIAGYNANLHLCCLLTYGCLLRPHREIRMLTGGDIDLSRRLISLSGDRTKNGRVRTVPIPDYVIPYLQGWGYGTNIFSNTEAPFNPDYFKSLWTRYKAKSDLISPQQTLYSFRHTAAIALFEKTGSVTKLSRAMDHSSLEVTLGYLRNLGRTELTTDDMPSL